MCDQTDQHDAPMACIRAASGGASSTQAFPWPKPCWGRHLPNPFRTTSFCCCTGGGLQHVTAAGGLRCWWRRAVFAASISPAHKTLVQCVHHPRQSAAAYAATESAAWKRGFHHRDTGLHGAKSTAVGAAVSGWAKICGSGRRIERRRRCSALPDIFARRRGRGPPSAAMKTNVLAVSPKGNNRVIACGGEDHQN